MECNQFIKFLFSIPVILILMYFIPFLGVVLLLLRSFICKDNKNFFAPTVLILFSILIFIPKCLDIVFDIFKLNTNNIPYYNDIINSDLYNINFINYGKRLFTVGIIYFVLSFIITTIISRLNDKVSNYINELERRNDEIAQRNDLITKEKREMAKNTRVVYCPYCVVQTI